MKAACACSGVWAAVGKEEGVGMRERWRRGEGITRRHPYHCQRHRRRHQSLNSACAGARGAVRPSARRGHVQPAAHELEAEEGGEKHKAALELEPLAVGRRRLRAGGRGGRCEVQWSADAVTARGCSPAGPRACGRAGARVLTQTWKETGPRGVAGQRKRVQASAGGDAERHAKAPTHRGSRCSVAPRP